MYIDRSRNTASLIEAVKQFTRISTDMNTVEFSGNADFEWAVRLNRFSLKLVGLWPVDIASSRKKLSYDLRIFSVIIALTCVYIIPSLHSLIRVWGDITAVIDNIMFTSPGLILLGKMLIMWWKRETLLPLITMIAHDWIRSKSSDERNVMVRCARTARLIITCSYILTITTLILLLIISGLGYNLRQLTNDTGRPLPLQAHYMYNTSVSPQYEITFFIQSVTTAMGALTFVGINNFLGLFLFHICGQLENLTNRLYRMSGSANFTEALQMNVKEHIRLIRFVAIIEDTFTLILLLLFFFFASSACIYGFLIVTVILEDKNVSIKRAIFLIMDICAALLNICVYCAVGELLVARYEQVYTAICECKWYMLKPKEAKNLIFLMVRTYKPLYITVGKLLPMTMSTFCSILKTSVGYISVLLANRN